MSRWYVKLVKLFLLVKAFSYTYMYMYISTSVYPGAFGKCYIHIYIP